EHKKLLTISNVLMTVDGKDINIGMPYVKDCKVVCEVIGDIKGPKVVAYKFKRRKSYHRKVGHREMLTKVKIKEIK
ncbi:MAG: 50S ribosomal protein L21, partial [Candidatus Omnitrophota bacterium]